MIRETNPYLVKKQKGYPIFSSAAPHELLTSRTAQKKTRLFLCGGFARISQLVNQNFVKILEYWYKSRPNDFMHFVREFITDSKAITMLEDEIRRTKDKSFTGLPPTDFIFYVKERLHCSNALYTELRLWLSLEHVLPPERKLDELKSTYNRKVWDFFGYKLVHEGFI